MSQLSLGLPITLHVQLQQGTRLSRLQTRTDNAQRMGITSREPGTVHGTARRPHFSHTFISVTVQLWTQVFWVISVYFNIRNTLPKSGTFLLGHPVYVSRPFATYRSMLTETWTNIISAISLFKYLSRLSLHEHVHTKTNKKHLGVTITNTALNN